MLIETGRGPTNQGQTEDWLTRRKPEVVIIAAAVSEESTQMTPIRLDYIADNQLLGSMLFVAVQAGVSIVFGAWLTCIDPKLAPQPMNGGGASDRAD